MYVYNDNSLYGRIVGIIAPEDKNVFIVIDVIKTTLYVIKTTLYDVWVMILHPLFGICYILEKEGLTCATPTK